MFLQSLYVQWRWSQKLLGALAVLAFGSPLLFVRLKQPESYPVPNLLAAGIGIGVTAAMLAVAAALLLGVIGTSVDERNGNTYSLSLPITRWQFVMHRAGGSLILLLIPAIALWLGCLVAIASANLPAPLTSYPGMLALRTVLASWLTFAIYFALRNITGKYFSRLVLIIVVLAVVLPFTASLSPQTGEMLSRAGMWIVEHPGPFGIFFGHWTLIDV